MKEAVVGHDRVSDDETWVKHLLIWPHEVNEYGLNPKVFERRFFFKTGDRRNDNSVPWQWEESGRLLSLARDDLVTRARRIAQNLRSNKADFRGVIYRGVQDLRNLKDGRTYNVVWTPRGRNDEDDSDRAHADFVRYTDFERISGYVHPIELTRLKQVFRFAPADSSELEALLQDRA